MGPAMRPLSCLFSEIEWLTLLYSEISISLSLRLVTVPGGPRRLRVLQGPSCWFVISGSSVRFQLPARPGYQAFTECESHSIRPCLDTFCVSFGNYRKGDRRFESISSRLLGE